MIYYIIDNTHCGVSADGTLPTGAVECTEEQYQNASAWTVANDQIVAYTPPLAQVQAAQITALQSTCQAAIEAGFTSAALGASANYPSDPRSQVNIALAAANGGSLWCETGTSWAFTAHTAAQAQQVQKDLTAHIQSCQSQYAGLLAQVIAAASVAAAQAVVWS
ncbi:hypothetical protein [Acidocella sp.]|uniref:DUF4376 domain-containing protein n=1 Tax=Acidocella sp. TaxID=50710 RepID=UPI002624E849|nr:hypothetical protein [Acidocella sp.]